MSRYPSPFVAPAILMLETRLSEVELQRLSSVLSTPGDAAQILRELVGHADREHFVALYLNSRHQATHLHIVSRGTSATAPVHPREVFKGALLANASALIVGHNHPSGDVQPSQDDRRVEKRLREAGDLLGIELLDSLIVGPGTKFYSAADDAVRDVPRKHVQEAADGP